jgi:hypothetical protein
MNEHMELHEELKHISDEMAVNGKSEALETRLRRLEDAIAAIADTRLMEERLMERVISRMDQPPQATLAGQGQPAPPMAYPPGIMLEAGKALLPGAMHALSNELRSATNPHNPQTASILAPQSWLFTDLIYDFRTIFALYFDYRYHPSWTAKIVPPLGLIAIVLVWIFVRWFDLPINILLMVIVYKSLVREVARYRAVLPFLPPKVVT